MVKKDYIYISIIIILLVWCSLLTSWQFKDFRYLESTDKVLNSGINVLRADHDKRLDVLEDFRHCFKEEAHKLNLEGKIQIFSDPFEYYYTEKDITEMVEKCANLPWDRIGHNLNKTD